MDHRLAWLSACALLSLVSSSTIASAQGAWCARLQGGRENCSFATLEQCGANVFVVGGTCFPNPRSRGARPEPWRERDAMTPAMRRRFEQPNGVPHFERGTPGRIGQPNASHPFEQQKLNPSAAPSITKDNPVAPSRAPATPGPNAPAPSASARTAPAPAASTPTAPTPTLSAPSASVPTTPVPTLSAPSASAPTPPAPSASVPTAPAATVPPSATASTSSDVDLADIDINATPTLSSDGARRVQVALKGRGFDPGPIDGILNPQMQAALRTFQTAYGIKASGIVDNQTLFALGEADLASPSAESQTK